MTELLSWLDVEAADTMVRSRVPSISPASPAATPHSGHRLTDLLTEASTSFQRHDLDSALRLLVAARREFPTNQEVVNLIASVESIRRERIHAQVLDIWANAA